MKVVYECLMGEFKALMAQPNKSINDSPLCYLLSLKKQQSP